ncbi:glucosaminidase domain-containing protein [Metasolibacillus meyeri]|uniref:Peptidoglycan hydrolase n=1 Tax=Metasolibacillus meyeri TaxID=1071052 RepID=A0AAW9NTN6_9BACL|nr:glucosaminidase domain-containing protein [Metasolibacillus meyeri]MEC1179144.1 glucosaminidase domain-containing protein [Metasolibacillus meyeri]
MKLLKRLLFALGILMMLFVLGIYMLIKTFSLDEYVEPAIMPLEEDLSAEQFIGAIGETARKLANENDLYASVMLAQAILESNKGQSGLASEPNYNLFGIKGAYNNQSVALETQEDDGKGNLSTILAEFRKYPSYEASMQDYIKLLRNGVSWNKTIYHGVFKSNTTSYQEATNFLTGTYATDSKYKDKLNRLIEQYDLTQYDHPIQNETTITVQAEDSLNSIAESYNVSVTSLKQWNKLQSSSLQEGQTLMIYETKVIQ